MGEMGRTSGFIRAWLLLGSEMAQPSLDTLVPNRATREESLHQALVRDSFSPVSPREEDTRKREEDGTHRVLRDDTTRPTAGTGHMLHAVHLMVALRIQRLRADVDEDEESQRNCTPTLDATPRARRHGGAWRRTRSPHGGLSICQQRWRPEDEVEAEH